LQENAIFERVGTSQGAFQNTPTKIECRRDERFVQGAQSESGELFDRAETAQCFVEMATEFKSVVIPEAFARLIGVADDGTRIFRAEGNHAAMRRWFDALCEYIGPCVSPGGAAVYAKVSRAAVYRRMKAGGLTAFCFHIIGKTKTIFGKEKKFKEWPLVYIPVAECKAWGAELDERGARLEANRGTQEDEAALEEAEFDEDGPRPDFVHYDPNDKRRRDVKYMTGKRRIEETEETEEDRN
jgi:hypothetical protein